MKYVGTVLIFITFLLGTVSAPLQVFGAYPTIYADGVLAHTNAQRYFEGLPMLESNPALSRIAARKMQDLFARQYFAHEAPTGEDVGDLAKSEGYAYLAIGENLALGDFTSSKVVVDAWMDSPGHRENILAPKFTEIGIAAGRSMHEGRYTWVVVQTFGLPLASCPTPDTVLAADMEVLSNKIAILEIIAHMREASIQKSNTGTRAYREQVASYNLAAEIYNTHVTEYRALIKVYNQGIEAYNACLTDKTS